MTEHPELKGLIADILNKFIGYITGEPLKDFVFNTIEKEYNSGLTAGEIHFNMNFTPDYRSVSFIQKYAFNNVLKLTDDMKDDLRKQLAIGLMNGEGIPKLKLRVMTVMDSTVARAEMITRTETVRAFNMGNYQAANDSGLDLKKQWSTHEDERTCVTCNGLDGQVVGKDEHFTTYKGEQVLLSPAHPSCRCRILYIQKHAEIKDKE